MTRSLVIGHRGAKAVWVENSMQAFSRGFLNVDGVECDVQLSKDNRLVVFHDCSMERMTREDGFVHDYTFDELRKFCLINHRLRRMKTDHYISSLEQVMDMAISVNKILVVEIKAMSVERAMSTAEAVADLLQKKNYNKVIVQSFWLDAVKWFKQLVPDVKTLLIMEAGLHTHTILELVQNANADGINLACEYLTRELIELFHNEDLIVYTYTVNSDAMFNNIKEKGVDGIITDCPGKIK